ncbi:MULTISPECIES: fumarylacetoacetate hydrolase family protein [Methylosinus]|uniref:FAA hydrolase family protein n=1 Tax=Methylosinus trichosporium (strain ATCC 35070 / NCIMB 11131 / UNIQEM 75 / OB3b) TaxID=595536 RepID=A0A2D2D0Q1_METT3|nr:MULTISPECIES: fumarylacetoacetate hydrolase family protein [Methylosinus]ATQ68575.1 FAA hydrolase family protein [Methylosinus trichosporium OB3b]OBS52772.1 fumarylacetoacetate hydrolase [Methylosinus sp. 3S-1]
MSEFVFPPQAQPSIAIAGETRRFPVRRIFCVGQNYAAHAREMGKDPSREEPCFFTKPADAVVASGATLPYPPRTADLHHEIELVAALAQGGADIAKEAALDHVLGYAAGIDLTRRDLQSEARKAGRPWDLSKGFDHSAPLGAIAPAARIGHPRAGRIRLAVNGTVRQDADLSEMIWSVAEIIAILSQFVRLEPGDLIFTGTPAGVGPIVPGDHVAGDIEGVGAVEIAIGR